MRIISKFQDYYDSVLAYGHDETLTYVRKQEETFWLNENIEKILRKCGQLNSHIFSQTPFLLGFCGSFYYGFRISVGCSLSPPEFQKTFYSEPEVWDYIQRISGTALRKSEMTYYDGPKSWRYGGSPKERFEKFFDTIHPDSDEMFFDLGSPVFIVEQTDKPISHKDKGLKITTNPCLKNYDFYKVEDAFQTFQKIDQYLSGVLGQAHPPMIQISDIDMRDKKGFDEWSFKTRPGSKK